MLMKRWDVWVLVSCTAMGAIMGCSSTLGQGESCTSDPTMCEEGLVCITMSTGGSECRERLSPSDDTGVCAPEVEDQCVNGSTCENGRCAWVDGHTCSKDAECKPGAVCRTVGDHKACAVPAKACERCDSDSDCVTSGELPGVCEGGLCIQGLDGICNQDACCASGQFCYANKDPAESLHCAYPQTEPLAPCAIDAHCANKMVCSSNQCHVIAGNGCTVSDQCDIGLQCTAGVCVAQP